MDAIGAKHLVYLVLATTLLGPLGCANGPMPYLTAMNPSLRKQWAADEQYQPTLHRQLAEVDALRASADSLSAQQQRHWSGELKYIIETQKNPVLRAAAVKTLATFAVPESNEGLRIALKDSDSTVRSAACRAWGQKGGQEAIQHLSETLGSDSDPDVQILAARELGRFNDSMAFEALGLALDPKNNPALQYRAVESLKKASGRNYGNDLKAWRQFAQGQDAGPEYVPSMAERVRQLF